MGITEGKSSSRNALGVDAEWATADADVDFIVDELRSTTFGEGGREGQGEGRLFWTQDERAGGGQRHSERPSIRANEFARVFRSRRGARTRWEGAGVASVRAPQCSLEFPKGVRVRVGGDDGGGEGDSDSLDGVWFWEGELEGAGDDLAVKVGGQGAWGRCI